MVSHLGQTASPSSAPASQAGPKEIGPNLAPAQLSYGPEVQFRHAGHTDSIQAVQSTTNYQPATFEADVKNAVSSQQLHNKDLNAAQGFASSSTSAPTPTTGVTHSAAGSSFPAGDIQRLRGCVDSIAAGRRVLLVELASFEHLPAAIIVVGETASSTAEGFAVGVNCSATNKDILFSLALPHL